MKFYNREKEIEVLRGYEANASEFARMTILVGRRRVGKTTLLRNAFVSPDTLFQ